MAQYNVKRVILKCTWNCHFHATNSYFLRFYSAQASQSAIMCSVEQTLFRGTSSRLSKDVIAPNPTDVFLQAYAHRDN